METRVEALRRVPLFSALGDDELAHVAEAVNEVEVPAGQLLVQPGAPGSGMFFIADGTAVVETKRDEVELGPGQFFGELAHETVEASAGGGMVTVTATGAGEITEIKIDPKAIDPDDPELLEDMVLAAVNEALRSSQSLIEAKLGPAMGGLSGLGLPGL